MKKRRLFGCLCLIALLILGTVQAFAASSAPKAEPPEYKGKKIIEVEFKGKVEFKNPAVKVKDSSGKYYKTVIVEKDDNDIKFKVPKLQSGKNYIYKISGIRKKGSGNYTKVKGSFRIAAKNEVLIQEVEYDRTANEVNFEIQGSVKWKKAKVVITDSKGRNYVKRIIEKDKNEIAVKVKKLKAGKKYRYKISGVARKGSCKYKTVKGSFTP